MSVDARLAQSALYRRPSALGKALAFSITAHVVLIVVVWVFGVVSSRPKLNPDQKPIQARLVRKGTPRDQKLLPRKEALPPPPAKVEAPPPPPEAKPPPPEPQPKAPTVAVAAAPPKAKPTPQKGDADADRRKRLFGAFDKLAKAPPEDLEGAEDGDELGDAARAEGERYWALLSAQVRRHYDVSQTIPDQERIRLRAQVVLFISRTGELTRSELAKPSGNALFDGAVLLAVKKASPFAPPPSHLRQELQRRGVTLEFSP